MEYDDNKYKLKNWKSFTFLHWIVNPGLAFNELVLGQRIPKQMLIDKTSDKPLMERSYVPCPHCETLHDGRIWSTDNGMAFKNWFGYYCPECGNIIPCLHNGLAYLLLAITYPLWGWFKNDLKKKWLANQHARYSEINADSQRYEEVSWMKIGLIFGGIIFIASAGIQLILGSEQLIEAIGVSALSSAVGGLGFGLVMKYWMGLRGKQES
ncbi:MAG: hypothetical protein U5J63_08775 [Fodinibius sp.]|nr:hypothetical protein [Fodinibius sp.]